MYTFKDELYFRLPRNCSESPSLRNTACYRVLWHGDFKFATKNKYFYPMGIMPVGISS